MGNNMNIWVDADACPKAIKEILFRAADRTQTPLFLVSNHVIYSPPSKFISRLLVSKGLDVADNEIVARINAGDLVITADIPLADAVIEKSCLALNPRGELYTRDNIKARLSLRNFMDDLRSTNIHTPGPSSISPKDIRAFANMLDRILAKKARE